MAMNRVVTAVALMMVVTSAGWARTEAVPLQLWRVDEGDSIADGQRVVLRPGSPAQATVALDASRVLVQARWLEPVEPPRPTISLKLTYDDGVTERLRQDFPEEAGPHELVFGPEWSAGRIVHLLELMHDREGAQVEVLGVTVDSPRMAVTMHSSVLRQAELELREPLTNDLLLLDWMTISWHRPHLTRVRSRRIGVVAATIASGDFRLGQEEELILEALDEDGEVLARTVQPVTGEVRRLEFVFEGLDLDRVEEIAFEAEKFAKIAVRQIVVGGWTPVAAPGDLQELNDRLDEIIKRFSKPGGAPEEMIRDLHRLLRDYRELE